MARDECRDRHFDICCHICNWEHPEDRFDKATLDEKIYTEGLEIVENGLSSFHACPCCHKSFGESEILAVVGLLAIRRVFHRPWFSRLWVVQEVMAINEDNDFLHIGIHTGVWSSFNECFQLLTTIDTNCGHLSKSAGISTLDVRLMAAEYSDHKEIFVRIDRSSFLPETVLCDLLYRGYRRCLNPRDRIFAMYMVFQSHDGAGLRPDYTLSKAQIYRTLTIACREDLSSLTSDPSWEWLGLFGTGSYGNGNGSYPSWVVLLMLQYL